MRRHYDFHTVLNIVCSTFLLLFTTHTHVNFSLVNTTFHQKYYFIPNRNWNGLTINSFIKSRKLLLRSCFTSLINVRSPCLLVDLGRYIHGLFSISSHGSNLFKNLDTADRLYPMIFPIFVFFNPS